MKSTYGIGHVDETSSEDLVGIPGNLEPPSKTTAFPESGNGLKGRYTLPFSLLSESVRGVSPDPQYLWSHLIAEGAVTLLGG